MSADHFGDAVTALVAALQAWVPLAGIPVYDGSTPVATQDEAYIIVGHDGALDVNGALSGITQAGTVTAAWLDYGTGAGPVEEETGRIHCVAVSQTGDTTALAACRAQVQVLIGASSDAAISAEVELPSGVMFQGLEDATYTNRSGSQGIAVVGAFGIGYSVPWT